MPSAGEIFAGRYRIQERLAQGGMGIIYVAEHLATEELVALKVLWPHVLGSKAAVESFQLEARLNARIGGEHIVRILDAGLDEKSGLPFLSMELLRGATLRALVGRRGPFSPAETALIMRQVAKALDKAHGHVDKNGNPSPIVHRDLKPENLFLAAREGGAVVKVLDFGIAKVLSQNQGQSQEVRGTPPFMAYEQFTRGPVTPKLDVWALGLIAFYLLTGRKYWLSAADGSGGFAPLLTEILSAPIAPPTERARALGLSAGWAPAFDEWFLQCVNRNLDARFGSAGAAAAALEAALSSGGRVSRAEALAARAELARRIAPLLDRASSPSLGDAPHASTGLSLEEASPGAENVENVDSVELVSEALPANAPAAGVPPEKIASGPWGGAASSPRAEAIVPRAWDEEPTSRLEVRDPLRSYAAVTMPGLSPLPSAESPASGPTKTLPLATVSTSLPPEPPSPRSRRISQLLKAAFISALVVSLSMLGFSLGLSGRLSSGRGAASSASATALSSAKATSPKAAKPSPPPLEPPAGDPAPPSPPPAKPAASQAPPPQNPLPAAQGAQPEASKRNNAAEPKKPAEKAGEAKKYEGAPPAPGRGAPKPPAAQSAPPKDNMYNRR